MNNNMNKQEKIDNIYEVIADKTLSFGCRVKLDSDTACKYERVILSSKGNIITDMHTSRWIHHEGINYETIGHPVVIGDVLDWIENNEEIVGFDTRTWMFEIMNEMTNLRDTKRKPIEDQSEECIYYIYDLISNKD